MVNLLRGQDAIFVRNLDDGLDWYAGYVGGFWPTYSPLVQRFSRPGVRFKSVAVNASEFADILDIEHGDALISEALTWFQMMRAAGHPLPGFYTSLDNVLALVGALTGLKLGVDYVLWVAHYDGVAELEAGGQAKQYADPGRVDLDVASLEFWGENPLPVHHNPPHYDWFPGGSFLVNHLHLDERAVVRKYDRLRALQTPRLHPRRVALAILRLHLHWLAGRVWTVSHHELRNGRPSWGVDHRGWRYQQLIHRVQGGRIV